MSSKHSFRQVSRNDVPDGYELYASNSNAQIVLKHVTPPYSSNANSIEYRFVQPVPAETRLHLHSVYYQREGIDEDDSQVKSADDGDVMLDELPGVVVDYLVRELNCTLVDSSREILSN